MRSAVASSGNLRTMVSTAPPGSAQRTVSVRSMRSTPQRCRPRKSRRTKVRIVSPPGEEGVLLDVAVVQVLRRLAGPAQVFAVLIAPLPHSLRLQRNFGLLQGLDAFVCETV